MPQSWLPEYRNIPVFSNFGHVLLARFIRTYIFFRTCKYPSPEYSKYFRSMKNLYVCERFLEQIQHILCIAVTMAPITKFDGTEKKERERERDGGKKRTIKVSNMGTFPLTCIKSPFALPYHVVKGFFPCYRGGGCTAYFRIA